MCSVKRQPLFASFGILQLERFRSIIRIYVFLLCSCITIYHLSSYERCWQLDLEDSVTAANYSVALEITDFELQYSPSCLFDKLIIYCVDGGTVLTNAQPPPPLQASSAICNATHARIENESCTCISKTQKLTILFRYRTYARRACTIAFPTTL